jgi:hypothetical protein
MIPDVVYRRLFEEVENNRLLRPLWQAYKEWRVIRRSPYDNIFHCCTPRTASQWLRALFRDPIFHQYTGLGLVAYPTRMGGLGSDVRIPAGVVAAHLYIDYSTYAAIPKPSRFKTIFILRDPRDIVVSYYYAALRSHRMVEEIPQVRAALRQRDKREGLKYVIDTLDGFGLFAAQRQWVQAPMDSRVSLLRYEELAGDNAGFLARLLRELSVQMPAAAFETWSARHRFSEYAGGRRQGQEDEGSHYRRGTAGDSKAHFDADVMHHFRVVTGTTLEELGYEI